MGPQERCERESIRRLSRVNFSPLRLSIPSSDTEATVFPALSDRLKRESGMLLIMGSGAVLIGIHLTHAAQSNEGLQTFLLGILIPLGGAMGVFAGGAWLARSTTLDTRLLRIGLWTIFIAFVVMGGQGLTILYQQAEGVTMSHGYYVLANAATAGAVVGLVIGIYDARQQQARARSERLQSQLTVLNRVLRHDIRNGATVIQGRAEIIAEDLAQTEHAERIQKQAADLVQLGEHARTIEQLQRQGGANRESVDITTRVEAHIDDLEDAYPEADIESSVSVDNPVYAHSLIDTAIANVLQNAVEHNDSNKPSIEVTCSPVEEPGTDMVEIRFSDDGPGIPPDEVEVLERGYETPLDHTSGLGLWLVNWIVTASGGSVWFEENDGGGSIVAFRLETVESSPPDLPAPIRN